MATVGVRELKTHASEIVRQVREAGVSYTVTYRGEPVGLLSPLPTTGGVAEADDSAWAELERLGEEIAHGWQAPVSSTELLSEMRR